MKKLQRRLTADKRLRYAPPKLPLATSFIHKPLYEMAGTKEKDVIMHFIHKQLRN